MLFSAAFAVSFFISLDLVVAAGQIPVVDGVLGGVSSKLTTHNPQASPSPLTVLATAPGKLRFKSNPGVCETTPGVFSATGYGDITATQSLWFWYFDARNDPDTAPLALWLNGGPGSSSMIGLFQELGPCRINNASTGVSLNPTSWSTNSNFIFIDQPVGVGYSHGDLKVGTSQQAAADTWTFLQIFFSDAKFAPLAKRPFALWTESYGGHYGPEFAAYFLSQNAAIAAGKISGIPINLKTLGVGDGLTNPLIQYPGYISYSASNPYHTLTTAATIQSANTSWTQKGGCRDQITNCYATGTNSVCSAAQSFCNNKILSPLAGNWDVYYVPTRNPDPYPPELTNYLRSIASKIGAEAVWSSNNGSVYNNFASTGDWMHNSAPALEKVINAGVRTIIYDGDADYILNFNGVEAMVDNLNTQFSTLYATQSFKNYTVGGEVTGIYKNAGTFSYVRIFGAGHEVPAYKFGKLGYGVAALQMFEQVMSGGPLVPT